MNRLNFAAPMIKFYLNGNDIELGRVRLTDDQRTSQGKYLRRTIKIKDIDVKKPHLNWQCQANNAKGYDVSDQMEVTYKCKSSVTRHVRFRDFLFNSIPIQYGGMNCNSIQNQFNARRLEISKIVTWKSRFYGNI